MHAQFWPTMTAGSLGMSQNTIFKNKFDGTTWNYLKKYLLFAVVVDLGQNLELWSHLTPGISTMRQNIIFKRFLVETHIIESCKNAFELVCIIQKFCRRHIFFAFFSKLGRFCNLAKIGSKRSPEWSKICLWNFFLV